MSDDEGCRGCQGVVNGRCWRHGGTIIFRGETRIPIPPEAVDEITRLREELAARDKTGAAWSSTVAALRVDLAAARRETLKAAARIVRAQQTATMVFGADPLEHAARILDARAIDLAIDRFLAPSAATPPPCETCGGTRRLARPSIGPAPVPCPSCTPGAKP